MSLLCAQYLRQAEVLKADMSDSKPGTAEVWTSRQALQDLYQKMLVTDLEYALDKKVEQDLWNHAFKNQITTLQGQAKNRTNPNRSEVQANLSLFLEAASGFYTQLLQELCTVFNVDLPCRVKSSQLGIISNKQIHCGTVVKPQSSSCSYICQHCLVHLGDIARYRNQTSQAESYYRHAAQLVPSNGQPYNQLAILASSKGDHLTTIFYYCRSIAVKFPFPAASTNLQKALSKALESREEMKSRWSVSDFIKAFIKFHGHVYLAKSLEKVSPLREQLEVQFKNMLFQKAFNSQQLVHITVINLFQLHHLRSFGTEAEQQTFSKEEDLCWSQLLALFMSFLGILCRSPLKTYHCEETACADPLPAIKVSLDWMKLRPTVFQETAVEERQYVWPWLISLLNSFHVLEEDLSSANLLPLPEEFELQGFLALRPAFRNLDFSRGHQAITGDKDAQHRQLRPLRLVSLGKWICETHSRLMQYRSVAGEITFFTDIPELLIEDADELDDTSSPLETCQTESQTNEGSPGLKSVLCTGRSPSCETSEKPVVTFKENIKPQEVNREIPARSYSKTVNTGKEQRDFTKGMISSVNKKDINNIKRKTEPKKPSNEKMPDLGKQSIAVQVKSQTELRKTPVSEARKTPVTPTTSQSTNAQFIPIHHPGAFPPLPSRPGFPPPAYVIPPPVAFSMSSGYNFPAGVPGSFLQPSSHSSAGNQGPPGKPSHIPYSQQRPSGPGTPNQTALGQTQAPSSSPTQSSSQTAAQLQIQTMAQQQQSPTKPIQSLGKNPQHHPSLQQVLEYQQTDASKQLWSSPQVSGPIGKLLSVKHPYYIEGREPLSMLEQCLQHPVMQQPLEKKMKPFNLDAYNQSTSDVKMADFYWGDSSYNMPDNRALLAHQSLNQRGKRQPTGYPSGQDSVARMPFEEPKRSPLLPPDLLKSLAALEEEEELAFSPPPDFYPALLGPLASLPGRSLFSLLEKPSERISQPPSFLSLTGFSLSQERYPNNSVFNEVYGKSPCPSTKPELFPPVGQQETSLYSLFEGKPWSPSLPASSDHSTPASQSPHSSNPSSLPSSPPTHNHTSQHFSNFGPIGTPDSRDRRCADRWKSDKPAMGSFGLDYLSVNASSENSWRPVNNSGSGGNAWAAQGNPREDSSAALMESLKSIWSTTMMHPGPSALEQLLKQQKEKQQRGQGSLNPPH
ncbi:nonsense-mediated mRNA decay factor SMG7 isoform X2 [Bombina bombina]|uniref:nonsense-mediated mRNA decay factor SMG7 isoform X2 n=1 Tax=Bombina bombina TaxID=8345 RepID=UPI00235A5020|nr:nonsense-mediated mRNA decay factor SMG7 isoform X2 [Bombina bombina]